MKPWTDYLWLDSFFRVPEFVYSWTQCAHLPIYMHLPNFCNVVALVWRLRSETAPLLWFICIFCLLWAQGPDSTWVSVYLESACSLWVNYEVVRVYWRDLLTGKCDYFFHIDCESCCPLFWTVHCFLKSSLLWSTLCFLSGATHMSAIYVSVILSGFVIRWLSSLLQKSWPLQWSQG